MPSSPGGEMAERIRTFDWSHTPLGPTESWSPALRTMVRLMLANRLPMLLWWGPQYVSIYNDPYRPVLGNKHPRALGQPVNECWKEIWHVLQPLIDTPFHGGPATWDEDILLVINRHGFAEETHWLIAYSPVPDESVPGGIGGVLATVHETTEKVVGERRMAALRDLGTRPAEAKTAEVACAGAARALGAYATDVPFALLYLTDADGKRARLAGASGAQPGEAISPTSIDVEKDDGGGWPLARTRRTGQAQIVADLASRFPTVPPGPWPDPPTTAVVLPIPSNKPHELAGFFVAGVSSRLRLDDAYRVFLDLAATQVATAVATARAYEEEKKRAEALAELDRAKTAFFSNVSHEFRTPLTLLLGPVENLLAHARTDLSPDAAGQLGVVHRNGLRLLRLVNTLLDFSRIEAGRARAVYQPTDLAAFTAELAGVFRAACEKAGLRLVVDCPPLPEPVHVDREMWEKVVLNLLSNAFKFTFEGEIAVALRRAEGAVELRVRDSGTGIPAAEMPRLFERFHRVENARGRTHEGSGIGLALVQELVKLHGGAVAAESALGRGTTFTVTVPLGTAHLPPGQAGVGRDSAALLAGAAPYVEEALRWLPSEELEEGQAEDLSVPPSALIPGPSEGDRPRVLVADDNADMRQYLARLLAGRYEVEAVPDGEAALAAARARPPEVVLTDVMMPRLDGFGLLRELRADPRTRGLPVLLLSARAGEESRVEGAEAGADDYLVKPFSARELLARVGAHVQMARQRREAERALRQSEEQFRTLADNMSQLAWTCDRLGNVTWYNRRWLDYTGLSFQDMKGWDWSKVQHPDHLDRVVQRVRSSAETGEPWEDTFPLRGKDGQYRWFLSRALPIRDGAGEIVCWFGTNTDVTEQRELAQALKEADRRKDEFLATLAHELRNPLAPLLNGLQILRLAGERGEAAEQARAMMERQLGQMVRLIDELLDLSRVSSGKVTLRRQRVELAAVLRQAVETSRPAVEQAGHELTVQAPPGPVHVDADPMRLAQVLTNLLNNAIKYTEPGGRITLAVGRQGDEVAVSVRDTGVGIPAAMLPRVFDMFTQVGRSLEKSQGGLGIGLSLVKGLVEMHGGTVEARSDGPGTGSEFVVRLPIADCGLRIADLKTNPQSAIRNPQSRRVLVVDDNRDAADSLATMLRLLGHETRTAYDGLEALEAGAAFRPELVLLDLGMPRLNGYDTARRVRQEPWGRGVVLVALTGLGQAEDLRRSREAGFDLHLVKPFEPAALEKLLAGARGGRVATAGGDP